MATTIILKGEPKSTSHIYKARVLGRFASMYMSADGKKIKDSYINQALKQWKKATLKGDVEMYLGLYFGTKRKCDIDNFSKLILDSLTGIVYEDDNQIQRIVIEKWYDKDNPRAEIEVLGLT